MTITSTVYSLFISLFFSDSRKKKWRLTTLSATNYAGGFLVFLEEKNWLETIEKIGARLMFSKHSGRFLFSIAFYMGFVSYVTEFRLRSV
ncbi:hypothetical protein E4T83_00740 [Streptococcus sp. AN2]|nr:hypothetical protein E4T83_00740 [Streptococcus sp. AN2]